MGLHAPASALRIPTDLRAWQTRPAIPHRARIGGRRRRMDEVATLGMSADGARGGREVPPRRARTEHDPARDPGFLGGMVRARASSSAPVIEKVAAAYADRGVRLVKIDVDVDKMIAAQFRIQSNATVYALFQGQPVADLTSARTEGQLTNALDQLLAQLPIQGEAQAFGARTMAVTTARYDRPGRVNPASASGAQSRAPIGPSARRARAKPWSGAHARCIRSLSAERPIDEHRRWRTGWQLDRRRRCLAIRSSADADGFAGCIAPAADVPDRAAARSRRRGRTLASFAAADPLDLLVYTAAGLLVGGAVNGLPAGWGGALGLGIAGSPTWAGGAWRAGNCRTLPDRDHCAFDRSGTVPLVGRVGADHGGAALVGQPSYRPGLQATIFRSPRNDRRVRLWLHRPKGAGRLSPTGQNRAKRVAVPCATSALARAR